MRTKNQFRTSAVLCSILFAGLFAVRTASANPVINVGINGVQPNSADQLIKIYVSDLTAASLDDIEAEDVSVQIGNGLGSAPSITSVDLITGTIFAGNNSGQFPSANGNYPQANFESIYDSAAGHYVNANGLLATIHVSTLGVSSGSFTLSLGAGATRQGTSDFLNGNGDLVSATIVDGTLVVPEPASLGLIAFTSTALLARRRRVAR